MNDRHVRHPVAPALVAGATVVLSVLTLGLAAKLGQSPGEFLDGSEASQWLGGIAIGLTGAAVLRSRANLMGPILAVCGLLNALGGTAQEYAVLAHREDLWAAAPAAWWATFGWLPGLLGTLLAVPLLFPDGRLPSHRWRWPAWLASGAATGAVALVGTTQKPLNDGGFGWVTNPLNLGWADDGQLTVAVVLAGAAAMVGLAGTVRILTRLPHLRGDDRIRSALFALTVLAGLTAFASTSIVASFALNLLAFALLATAIVRYRLFDIETYLPRAFAYAVCIGVTYATYLLAATLTTEHARRGYVPALATAAAALIVARLLERVHRFIARLLFGERDRPAEALAALGARLAAVLDPDDVLPVTVKKVCESLRLPYAAIHLTDSDTAGVAAGERPKYTADFGLSHAGIPVGTLTVGLRAGERNLSERDHTVLTGFAHQVAVAAHGVNATRELRRSREEVVLAREAERQRLHRDLHDGIGPALAGISLGLETASRMVVHDAAKASRLLDDMRNETGHCVDDLRQVIADLRPPALDDVGLVGALSQHAELLEMQSGGHLRVAVSGTRVGRTLPPAVEVAAYRVAIEALTNITRHSGASRGTIELTCDTHLRLLVRDNGNGAAPDRAGTGLGSMRARAEELGGTCTVTFRPGKGVTVIAEFPLEMAR